MGRTGRSLSIRTARLSPVGDRYPVRNQVGLHSLPHKRRSIAPPLLRRPHDIRSSRLPSSRLSLLPGGSKVILDPPPLSSFSFCRTTYCPMTWPFSWGVTSVVFDFIGFCSLDLETWSTLLPIRGFCCLQPVVIYALVFASDCIINKANRFVVFLYDEDVFLWN